MSGTHAGHDHPTASVPLAFGLLTVSDTRRHDDDVSGRLLREMVVAEGHRVHGAAIVPDEPAAVRERILAWAADPACEVIVSSGGTGLSPRDHTVEAVSVLFDTRIDGFGELFRHLSFGEIGARAMLTRAVAGVVQGTPVFVLPGSPNAVTLGMARLVLPQIAHVIHELRRHGARG